MIRSLAVLRGLSVVAVAAVGAVLAAQRAAPATPLRFQRTPQRVVRGKYLVEAVAQCLDCHSEIEDAYARPVQPKIGSVGAGTTQPPRGPRTYERVYPNITPDVETGAGAWGDDLLARAIRRGIGHDDRMLEDRMPYAFFNAMTDEDVTSVVVYLRTLTPVRRALPKMALPRDVAAPLRPMPDPAGRKPVARQTPQARGEYLATLAACRQCHTPETPGTGHLDFGGGAPGFVFLERGQPPRPIVSGNITPSPSGIPYYDEPTFIKTMRTGAVNGVRELSTQMPWSTFRHMTDADLRDLWAYIRTVPPVAHRVSNTDPPTRCAICGSVHGLGDANAAPTRDR